MILYTYYLDKDVIIYNINIIYIIIFIILLNLKYSNALLKNYNI